MRIINDLDKQIAKVLITVTIITINFAGIIAIVKLNRKIVSKTNDLAIEMSTKSDKTVNGNNMTTPVATENTYSDAILAFSKLFSTGATSGQVIMYDDLRGLTWATLPGPLENKTTNNYFSTIVGQGTVTSVGVSGGTSGLSFSGGPITNSGTLTLDGVLAAANGGTGVSTGLSILNGENIINNSITLSKLSPLSANNNQYLKYTTSDGLSWADLPAAGQGTVTSVGVSGGTSGLSFSGGPITNSGTLTLDGVLAAANGGTGISSALANTIFAGPAFGSSSAPTFRDISTLNLPGPVYNVKAYGAIGNGVADDTTAIQNAIDASVGGVSTGNITSARNPHGLVYLPAGTYKITSPLLLKCVIGFRLLGDGSNTILAAGTPGMDSVIDIDGSEYSIFENFNIQGSGSGTVDKALFLHWTSASSQATESNTFRNIRISDLTFRVGFAIGTDNHDDVADNTFYDCAVSGQWTSGNTTTWQYGFAFGDGTGGNNLLQHVYRARVFSLAYGISWLGSSGDVNGGNMSGNGIDFYRSSPHSVVKISAVRSENSQRLYSVSGNTSAINNITLENIDFLSGGIASDGLWIKHSGSGAFTMHQVTCNTQSIDNNSITPKIDLSFNNNPTTRRAIITLDNITTPTALNDLIVGNLYGASLDIRNYSVTTSSDITSNAPASLVLKATTSQTENFFDAQNISGSSLFSVSPNGLITSDSGLSILKTLNNASEGLLINDTGGGGGLLINAQVSGVTKLSLNSNGYLTVQSLNITSPNTPATKTSAGTAGDIAWDSGYMYICIQTGTNGNALWKRTTLSEW